MSHGADMAPDPAAIRKIIHIDMDAFFASVEQRDHPELRGKPVAVGGSSARGVVAAASYEARVYGVRSAMPSVRAARLCPDLIFVRHRFEVYRAVSAQIRDIFADYTPLIEPLSLDEAYLDVTDHLWPGQTATQVAKEIRARIRDTTQLTASAGVSYNKFLAKLASDQNKPDGLCVITPDRGPDFVLTLPVGKFHGIGPQTARKMNAMGIHTGADLRAQDLDFLLRRFGKAGRYYWNISRGVDHRRVSPDRVRKSVGAENTYSADLMQMDQIEQALLPLADKVWRHVARHELQGRTVTLKVKFRIFGRSRAPAVLAARWPRRPRCWQSRWTWRPPCCPIRAGRGCWASRCRGSKPITTTRSWICSGARIRRARARAKRVAAPRC